MAYHESFWVVVGTAAPVIALADVVAFTQLAPAPGDDRRKRHPWVFVLWIFSYWSLAGSFLVQFVAFEAALQSLMNQADARTSFAYGALTIGIGLLFTGAGVSVRVGREIGRPEEHKPDRPRRYPVTGRQPSWRTKKRAP